MSLEAGAEISGYRLARSIGEGGMGQVWAAERDGEVFALKFLQDDPKRQAESRRRMLREARAARSVDHPNVVTMHDVLELDDGSPVLVMEYLEGESFDARIAREKPLALHDVASILLPVVSAVGAAHAVGIVHRDLKPSNIFLADDVVKVLDFGVAKQVVADGEETALTSSGAILGTPCYMSPEQAFGEADIDDRADVWALGIILYEALSGLLPTKADNVGQVLKIILTRKIWPLADAAPDLPEAVTSLVDRMLVRERDARPRLDEVLAVLTEHGDADVPSVAPSSVQRAVAVPSDEQIPEPRSAPTTTEASSKRWLVPIIVAAGLLMGWQLIHTDDVRVLNAPASNIDVPMATARPPTEQSVPSATSSAGPRPSAEPESTPPNVIPAAPRRADEFDPLKQRH
jgi:serine/threonine protein kinase